MSSEDIDLKELLNKQLLQLDADNEKFRQQLETHREESRKAQEVLLNRLSPNSVPPPKQLPPEIQAIVTKLEQFPLLIPVTAKFLDKVSNEVGQQVQKVLSQYEGGGQSP